MGEEVKLSPESAKTLADAIAKSMKGTVPTTSGTGSAGAKLFDAELSKATDTLNPFTKGLSLVKGAADLASNALAQIQEMIKPNLAAFQDLSKSGVSFSNDIAGMVIASKGMRLNVDEFSEVMKNNSSRFIAFGGNVTRGAEAFAKLSEEFMSSGYVDGLRQAGFTNKELNEILAMQMHTRRMSEKDDAASRKAAIESAHALATEMDLQAKLTGKSREEQMATMKKARDDMAIEAKLRQMAAEKGISVEEMRQEYSKQYNAAVLAGVENSFRETVLYGTARSKEAAMEQFGAGQATFRSSIEAGRKFVEGDLKATSEALKRAQTEGVEYQRTAQAQQIAMIPNATNPVVQATHKVMKQTMGTFDSMDAISQRADMKDKTAAEQAKFREEEARRAQAGVNELGKEASGASKALINFTSRFQDYEAALYKNIGGMINEKLGPGLGQFADQKLGAQIKKGADGLPSTVSKELDITLQKGIRGEPTGPQDDRLGFMNRLQSDKSVVLGGELLRDGAATFSTATDKFAAAINAINVEGMNALNPFKGNRQHGSIGMTGNLIEDFGKGSFVQLHGKESVLTEKQLMDMAKGINSSALSQSIDSFKNVTVSSTQNINQAQKTEKVPTSPNLLPGQPVNDISKDLPNVLQSMLNQNKQILSSINTKDIADVMQSTMSQSKQLLSSINTKDIADVMQNSMNQSKQVLDNINTKDIADVMQNSMNQSKQVVASTDVGNITNVLQSAIKESIGAFDAVDMTKISANIPSMTSLDSNNIQTVTPKNMLNSLQNTDIEKQFRNMSEKLGSNEIIRNKPTESVESYQMTTSQDKTADFSKQKDSNANLDDVVGSLNKLNSKLDRLLDTQLEIGSKQIRATKSNNSNLYAR